MRTHAIRSRRRSKPRYTFGRSVIAAFLFILGGVLLFTANVGVWVDRTVYEQDGFVETTSAIFDDEDVQQALAAELALQVYAAADLEARLQEILPPGLGFIAVPIGDQLLAFLERAALRVIQSDAAQSLIESSLRRAHAGLIRIIESDAISTANGIVIDLRPLLARIIEEIGLTERLEGVELDESILVRLNLPQDAGRFTISNAVAVWVFRIARYGDEVILAIVIGAAASLLASLAVAPCRRSMLRSIGVASAVVGVISLALLVPLRIFAAERERYPDAARAVVSILTEQFRWQSLVLVGAGALLLLLVFLLGESRAARYLRGPFAAAGSAAGEPMTALVRGYATALRIGGLVGIAASLLAWPDPTVRVQVTTLGLGASYFTLLWLVDSQSPVASSARMSVSRFLAPQPAANTPAGPPGVRRWMTRHVGAIRAAVVALGLVVLLVLPELTLWNVTGLLAVILARLAVVDMLAGAAAGP